MEQLSQVETVESPVILPFLDGLQLAGAVEDCVQQTVRSRAPTYRITDITHLTVKGKVPTHLLRTIGSGFNDFQFSTVEHASTDIRAKVQLIGDRPSEHVELILPRPYSDFTDATEATIRPYTSTLPTARLSLPDFSQLIDSLAGTDNKIASLANSNANKDVFEIIRAMSNILAFSKNQKQRRITETAIYQSSDFVIANNTPENNNGMYTAESIASLIVKGVGKAATHALRLSSPIDTATGRVWEHLTFVSPNKRTKTPGVVLLALSSSQVSRNRLSLYLQPEVDRIQGVTVASAIGNRAIEILEQDTPSNYRQNNPDNFFYDHLLALTSTPLR